MGRLVEFSLEGAQEMKPRQMRFSRNRREIERLVETLVNETPRPDELLMSGHVKSSVLRDKRTLLRSKG